MSAVLKLAIIDKIAEMLKDITAANGYYSTIREVNKIDVSYEQGAQLPRVNILANATTYSDGEGTYEAGRLLKKFSVTLDVYFEANSESDKQTKMAQLEADLEIRFGDPTIDGDPNYNMDASAYNLENTCLVVNFVDSIPYSLDEYQHIGNFEMTLDIYYRQKRNDPTQQY